MTLSRRQCIAASLAAAGSLAMPEALAKTVKAGTAPDSLNAIAKGKGLMFGSSIGEKSTEGEVALLPPEIRAQPRRAASFADPKVREITLRECGIVVPENELKWYAVRPDPVTYDWSGADTIIHWARKNGLLVRGHNLFWNAMRWTPKWVSEVDFGSRPATAAEKMLRDHIFKVCKRYGNAIFSYDVINETIDSKTGELEPTPFTKILGYNVMDICFHAAKEAAPHAELVYNDFPSWGADGTHRAAIVKLLEYAKKKNLPLDTLGVQAHIGFGNTGGGPGSQRDETAWRKFLDDVTGEGFGLIISEFDINDKSAPTEIKARDAEVAALTKTWLDIMLAYPQMRYVMAWGLVDKYSWLQEFIPRADGTPQRCALYDNDYRAKPLREAFAAAFAAAPARPPMKVSP
ncbi:endo-1,4-beta-xylanase [Rhizomicrobium palustre]|uniref:Beta-xylanase n=1 Tax=Rhizomicrobium palustre TaxID=189966 RepID=A0A846MYW8_9PROT|nr:endo-1,4-beta-xylanase [Rhizomicrobium palustre]NIK88439.1 endo-1,4-beta-xylanase [Rhizomicrobium palustre]